MLIRGERLSVPLGICEDSRAMAWGGLWGKKARGTKGGIRDGREKGLKGYPYPDPLPEYRPRG